MACDFGYPIHSPSLSTSLVRKSPRTNSAWTTSASLAINSQKCSATNQQPPGAPTGAGFGVEAPAALPEVAANATSGPPTPEGHDADTATSSTAANDNEPMPSSQASSTAPEAANYPDVQQADNGAGNQPPDDTLLVDELEEAPPAVAPDVSPPVSAVEAPAEAATTTRHQQNSPPPAPSHHWEHFASPDVRKSSTPSLSGARGTSAFRFFYIATGCRRTS